MRRTCFAVLLLESADERGQLAGARGSWSCCGTTARVRSAGERMSSGIYRPHTLVPSFSGRAFTILLVWGSLIQVECNEGFRVFGLRPSAFHWGMFLLRHCYVFRPLPQKPLQTAGLRKRPKKHSKSELCPNLVFQSQLSTQQPKRAGHIKHSRRPCRP